MAYSNASFYSRAMPRPPSRPAALCAAALAAMLVPAGGAEAAAQRRGDQERAYQAAQSGELKPFREIAAAARREAGGAPLIGTDYDSEASVYRLKFMRDGAVFWLDVDGRSGQIVGRSSD